MGIQLQLILTAYFVNSGWTLVPLHNPIADQEVTGNVDDEGRIRDNAFDDVNDELYAAQKNNANNRRNYDQKSNVGKISKRYKRGADGDGTKGQNDTAAEAEISSSTAVYVKSETTTLTPLHTFATKKVVISKNAHRYLQRFDRQQVLDIFPNKNGDDPFTAALFREYTGMEGSRVSRRSVKKVHGYIQSLQFRPFIREMNLYARKVPYDKLAANPDDNRDGLYYRAAFYLLLRCFAFKPTTYFDELMQEHGVISVETPLTVFLFAVNLGHHVDYDFNVTMDLVDGKSGKLLPRTTRTILCAGIRFDTQFEPTKIRHYRAVLRDRTRPKIKENVDSIVTLTPTTTPFH